MKMNLTDRVPIHRVAPFSKLGVSYVMGNKEAVSFYRLGPGEFKKAADGLVEFDLKTRKTLCGVLAEYNRSIGAGQETMKAIERLKRMGTMAVVTGQQAAPMTGPYYTILKAVTAVSLCRRLDKEYGLDCVPVFWAEGDDHDSGEISRAGLGYIDHNLREMSFEWPEELAGRPVGELPLPLSCNEMKRKLTDILPPSEYRDEVLRIILSGKSGYKTIGQWFSSLMASLFKKDGLIIAYSRHKGLRRLWSKVIPAVLEEGPSLVEEVMKSYHEIQSAGFKAQIHKKKGASPFFIIDQGKRLPVTYSAGGYTVGGRKTSREELHEKIKRDPSIFSPGVILRPVLQDTVLPTIAYVGGLSEISYLAQIKGVYQRLGVSMPVICHRLSATFVEPGRKRILQKYGLKPSQFITEPPEKIFNRILSSRQDLDSGEKWKAIEAQTKAPLLEYADSLPGEMDPMKRYIKKTAGKAGFLVRSAEKKIAQETRAREKNLRNQILDTGYFLYPERSLMERKLNIFYFMSKYGRGMIDEVLRTFPDDLSYHYFFNLEDN